MSDEQQSGAAVEAPPTEKNWVTVATADELADGRSKAVEVSGRDIALFRSGDEYFAVENECPHYGAPLCGGYVRGKSVMCAWHGWQFDMESGECFTAPGCDVEAYEVKIEDGQVKIAVG
jgi:NAD(P)H-dependent nitrite reductase small subunit